MNYWTNSRVHNGLPNWTYDGDCYDFSYFVLFTYVFSLFLVVSHGAATLTHFSLTHIAATLLTHSIAVVYIVDSLVDYSSASL